MQPIILLGVAVAAVALVGTGFLQTGAWNEFDVWVQQLGWGTSTIDSPVSHASIDLEIKKNLIVDTVNGNYYENVIDACSFHSADSIPAVIPAQGNRDGVIICKILGEGDRAIAEGRAPILQGIGYIGSTVLTGPTGISIDMCADGPMPEKSDPGCLDVMAQIHGVKVVVEAPVGMPVLAP